MVKPTFDYQHAHTHASESEVNPAHRTRHAVVDGGARNVNMDGAALVVAQPIMTHFFIFYKLLLTVDGNYTTENHTQNTVNSLGFKEM